MKKAISLLLSMVLIFALTLTVNAVDTAVTLKTDKSELKAGETFVVTISGSCEDGINGLTGSIKYNKDQLEVVKAETTDSNWTNIGQNSEGSVEIAIIGNSGSKIKTADIFKITFKIKDNVQNGTTIKVTPANIMLDSDAATNSEHNIDNVNEISINVKDSSTSGEQPGTNDPGTNDPGTNDPGTNDPGTNDPGTNDPGTNDPGTNNPGTNNPGTNNPGNNEQQKPNNNVTQNKNETNVNKNTAQSTNKMPYTGTNILGGLAIISVSIIAIVSYVSYRRYKNI